MGRDMRDANDRDARSRGRSSDDARYDGRADNHYGPRTRGRPAHAGMGAGIIRPPLAGGEGDSRDVHDTPARAPSRLGDTPPGATRSGRGADAERADAERADAERADAERAAPQHRGMRARAREYSQAISRQVSAMARGAERTVQRAGASLHDGARAQPRAALTPEMLAEISPQRYRRSRIRMRARKWRIQRMPRSPLALVLGFASVALLVVVMLGGAGAGGIYAFSYYNQSLPQIQAVAAKLQSGQDTKIYDRNGQLLYTDKGNGNFNYYVPLAQISPKLRNASIDTEDHTFYSNIGVDPTSTIRAAIVDVGHGSAQQGASTITQQLVKNIVLDNAQKQLTRKINEAILAVGVTLNYTKDQILEMYLNSIDYGDQNQGIEAAARNYFGLVPKTVNGVELTANQQLDYAQAALLAGLPNNPTYYLPTQFSCAAASCADTQWANPCLGDPRQIQDPCAPNPNYNYLTDGHEWLVWRRTRLVLDDMLKYGDISQTGYNAALQEVHDILQYHRISNYAGLNTGSAVGVAKNAPSFVDYVMTQWLEGYFGINPDYLPHMGLKIYTTLDLNLDDYTAQRLNYYINQQHTNDWYCSGGPLAAPCTEPPLAQMDNAHNGSAVAIDPNTGDILAMVGSVKYGSTDPHVLGYNNLATSLRSMGSSTKGIVYATAFQMGWYPGIMMQDQPICFPDAVPNDPTTNKPAITNPYAPACAGYYSPTNYDQNSFSGTAPIRVMLANSLNVPATEVMSFDGDSPGTSAPFISMAERLGVTSLTSNAMGPSTALGAQDMTLLQLTGAYATFANAGVRAPVRAILRIEDSSGNVIWQAGPPQTAQVLSPQAAYELTSVLIQNQARLPDFGWWNPLYFKDQRPQATGNPDYPGIQIAAKTGTSQGNGGPLDIVTEGYSRYLAVGVWIGNSDGNDPLSPGVIGIAGAGYVFHDMMQWAIQNYHWPANSPFPVPPDMSLGQFNCTTGLAPYKGTKIAPCKLTPVVPNSTSLYIGFNYAGQDTHVDQDWYVTGQAPLQS